MKSRIAKIDINNKIDINKAIIKFESIDENRIAKSWTGSTIYLPRGMKVVD